MLKTIIITGVTFGVLDSLWFALFMKRFAIESIGSHFRMEGENIGLNYAYTFLAYLFMVVIAAFFLVPKISSEQNLLKVFLWGSLMGVCVFGIFDFTNGALMKNYPLKFIVIDTLWGGFMYGVLALILSYSESQ